MSAVPPRYRGLWRRTCYSEPRKDGAPLEDRDTQVYWLQSAHWHADIRIPAGGPDFSGVASLADCDRERLIWLAGLTAFAGLTRVEGRFCTWHRLVDMRPGLDKDIGVMHFDTATELEERHPADRYRERWQREYPAGDAAPESVQLTEEGLPAWIQRGRHAFTIAPRPALADDHDLLAPPERLTDDALRVRAALAISYARRESDGWRIVLSTQPWRRGDLCAPPG